MFFLYCFRTGVEEAQPNRLSKQQSRKLKLHPASEEPSRKDCQATYGVLKGGGFGGGM